MDAEEVKRDGFLTTTHRKFLLGEKDVDQNYRSTILSEIRSRSRGAWADFRLIHQYLPDKEKAKLARPDGMSTQDVGIGAAGRPDSEVLDNAWNASKAASQAMAGNGAGDSFDYDALVDSFKDTVEDAERSEGEMYLEDVAFTWVARELSNSGYSKEEAVEYFKENWPE